MIEIKTAAQTAQLS